MKKFLRIGALCLALTMLLTVSAFAANENLFSSRVTTSVDGFTFDTWSILHVRNNNKYSASGNIQEMNSIRFSENVLGVSANVISETSGELVSSAMMGNSANDFLAFAVSPSVYTSDRVYASGAYKILTKNGTMKGELPPSPAYGGSSRTADATAAARATLQNAPCPVNERGETYGSLVISGSGHLDLILARGIDGTSGFVRAEDLELDSWVKTTEDAALFMKLYEGVNLIPLYDLEGKVIGSYMITVGNPQETEDGEEPAELLSDALLEKQAAAGDTAYFDQIKAAMAENAAKLAEKS